MEYFATKSANKALQKTQTALASFRIRLSHIGLLPVCGSLPVIRAHFGLLSAGVSAPRYIILQVMGYNG